MKSCRNILGVLMLLLAGICSAQDYDTMIQQALQQRNNGNMGAAELILRQAYPLAANKSEVSFLLGMVLAFQDRFDEAMSILDQALEQYPESIDLQLGRARVLSYQSEFGEATRMVEQILSSEPDNTEALNLNGRLALYQQRPGRARRIFAQTLEYNPDDLDGLLGMYDSYQALGRSDTAATFLERAATLNPGHIEVVRRQQPAAVASGPQHLLTAGFGRSTFDLDGLPEWNDHYFEYRQLRGNGSQQYLRVEHNHRFDLHDTLIEAGMSRGRNSSLPLELAIGFSPDDSFMPAWLLRLQASRVLNVMPDGWGSVVLTGLYQHSSYANGHTQRLLTGVEYYLPKVNAWLTPALGMVRDQDGINTFAWSFGAHWQIRETSRIGLSYSDAPETDNLITTDSRSYVGYLQQDLGAYTSLRLTYSRMQRMNSYTRTLVDLGLQYRF